MFDGSGTFTSASADVAGYAKVADWPREEAVMTLFVTADSAATGSASLELALTDGAVVYRRKRLTVYAGTGRRAGLDNASGDQLLTVADETYGGDVAHLMGSGERQGPGRGKLEWRIGLASSSLASFTSMTVRWRLSKAAMQRVPGV